MGTQDFATAGTPGRGSTAGDFVRSRYGGWVPRNHPDALPDDESVAGPISDGPAPVDRQAGPMSDAPPSSGPMTLGDLARPRVGGETPINLGDPSAPPPQPYAPPPAAPTAPPPDPTTLGDLARNYAPAPAMPAPAPDPAPAPTALPTTLPLSGSNPNAGEGPGGTNWAGAQVPPSQPSTPTDYAPTLQSNPAYGGYDQPMMSDLQQRQGSVGSLAAGSPEIQAAPAPDPMTAASTAAPDDASPLARRRRPRQAWGGAQDQPARAFGSLGRMASTPAWGGR